MVSKAKQKANRKYDQKAYERISLVVNKGKRNIIRQKASQKNMSVNAYINALIDNDLYQKSTTLLDQCRSADFESFKSNLQHFVKNYGEKLFIHKVDVEDSVAVLIKDRHYIEGMYLLSMTDYLCRLNHVGILQKYDKYRCMKLPKRIWPKDVILFQHTDKERQIKNNLLKNAIPEFLSHNIVEGDVLNVI